MKLNIGSDSMKLQGSPWVWGILFTLSLLSILEVYSASSNMSYGTGEFWKPMLMHSIYVTASVATAYLVHRGHLVLIKIALLLLYVVSLPMLLLAIFKGPSLNDANRWLEFAGVTIQPSEFAKMAIVGVVAFLFSAGYSKKAGCVKPSWFLTAVGLTLIPLGIILKENFSTAVIIGCVMIVLAGVANPPRKIYWGMTISLFVVGLVGFLTVKNMPQEWSRKIGEMGFQRFPTWVNRIQEPDTLPANPRDYPVYENLQRAHSRIAIATSGIVGRGPGRSVERDFLPQAYSDFIYAIVIEEFGWLAAIFVMVLYLVLFYCCIRIADDCKTRYARFLVLGLGLMITTQAMMNMAVAVGVMPVTGQPLPLMSKGGTSMVVTGIYIGIILSVSKTVSIRKEREKQEQTNTIEQ